MRTRRFGTKRNKINGMLKGEEGKQQSHNTFSKHSWPMALGSTLTSMMTAFGWLTRHHMALRGRLFEERKPLRLEVAHCHTTTSAACSILTRTRASYGTLLLILANSDI